MIPASKYPTSRHYASVGPYYCITGANSPVIEKEFLVDAVDEFVRYSIPPSALRVSAGVVDAYGVIVIAYEYQYPTRNAETAFEWTGTLEGVGELTAHGLIDPLLTLDINGVLE